LALLIGMITGAYSSIFIAAPVLGILKQTDKSWDARNIPRAVGEPLREMVMGGGVGSRRAREDAVDEVGANRRGRRSRREATADPGGTTAAPSPTAPDVAATPSSAAGALGATEAATALSHPPRPRKKKRR
jgi:hypothetical protein